MPEEINRILTDRLADLLFAPSRHAVAALTREGEPSHEIVFVGNVMVDALLYGVEHARAAGFRQRVGIESGTVVVLSPMDRSTSVMALPGLPGISRRMAAIAFPSDLLRAATIHDRSSSGITSGSPSTTASR
jgi:UDP-N-acetylglucosamine 2-epimerase (non-hydrolysing)